jgi:hypothetical protein
MGIRNIAREDETTSGNGAIGIRHFWENQLPARKVIIEIDH